MQSLAKITVVAPTTQLTTLAAAKTECDTTDDVSVLIDRASAALMTYCGRAFGLQTVTETWRRSIGYLRDPLFNITLRNADPLLLSYEFNQTPSSVTVDGGAALVIDTDYEVDNEAGLAWRLVSGVRHRWACATNIIAVYQTGWNLPNDSSPNLPADIEAACLALVRGAFNYVGSDPTVSRDMTEGVGLVNYFARSASALVIDAGLESQLARFKVRS